MKHIKIQTEEGKCGIYNLANVLQNEHILAYEDDPNYVPANSVRINKLLSHLNYDIRFWPILDIVGDYALGAPNVFAEKLIKSYFDALIKHLDCKTYAAMILGVQTKPSLVKEGFHGTSIVLNNEGLFYSDPSYEAPIKLHSINSIFYEFINIYAIYVPVSHQSGDYRTLKHNSYA